MPYPEVPDQDYSYSGFSQSLGDGSFPGPALDNDMASIFGSLEEFQAFLQGSFRSDGVLKPKSMPTAEDLTQYVGEAQAASEIALLAAEASENSATTAADAVSAAGASASAAAGSATAAAGSATAAGNSATAASASAAAAAVVASALV